MDFTRSKARAGLLSLALIGLATLLYLYNFHCVIPRTIYRSAQLSPTSLSMLSHVTQLKTIINLRGAHPDERWYQQESRYAMQHGITLIDVPLNSTHLPRQQDMLMIIEALLNAPKPLLLHCQGGADRTGLASAIALILKQATLEQARSQFSWQYYAFKKDTVGELVLGRYQQWLQLHHMQHNPDHFLAWAHAKGAYTLDTQHAVTH